MNILIIVHTTPYKRYAYVSIPSENCHKFQKLADKLANNRRQ